MARMPTFLPLPLLLQFTLSLALLFASALRGEEEVPLVGGRPSPLRSENESDRATRRIDGPANAPATVAAPMARAALVPDVEVVPEVIVWICVSTEVKVDGVHELKVPPAYLFSSPSSFHKIFKQDQVHGRSDEWNGGKYYVVS